MISPLQPSLLPLLVFAVAALLSVLALLTLRLPLPLAQQRRLLLKRVVIGLLALTFVYGLWSAFAPLGNGLSPSRISSGLHLIFWWWLHLLIPAVVIGVVGRVHRRRSLSAA